MKKSTAVLLSFCFFLLGIVVGFLFSPIKEGIDINSGNNCGNTRVYNSDKEEFDE